MAWIVEQAVSKLIDFCADDLLRRIGRRHKTQVDALAARLELLLSAHHLGLTRLLFLVPTEWKWTAAIVETHRTLAEHCGRDQLEWFASAFRVELSWLRGDDTSVAAPLWGYKELRRLVQSLRAENWLNDSLTLWILAEDYNRSERRLNRYAIVFSSPIFPDDEILRKHALFETEWNWRHWPCRRDTKAVVRWFAMELNRFGQVPVVPVTHRDFESVINGRALPAKWAPTNFGGYDHMEDRVLLSDESQCASEPEEAQVVVAYLRDSGLFQAAIST